MVRKDLSLSEFEIELLQETYKCEVSFDERGNLRSRVFIKENGEWAKCRHLSDIVSIALAVEISAFVHGDFKWLN